jgi:lipoic acid synthetase
MNIKKPDWLKVSLATTGSYSEVRQIVKQHQLHTICTSGKCPNIGDCWARGTATFMILGEICTRSCKFCNTLTGKPLALDTKEPEKVAESIRLMGLKHAVVTSVDRDDLEDQGANHWAKTIRTIKEKNPNTTIETLIPDFQGRKDLIAIVINAHPEIISHNMETVKRLTPLVRSAAKYDTSLQVLRQIAESGIIAKSGIMLGLGETEAEVLETMDDLRSVGCSVMTIGQYLQPTRNHLPVVEYITPQQFRLYEEIGIQKGFRQVESGPLVRSSYHAEKSLP